jgi:acetyl esterase/lipase
MMATACWQRCGHGYFLEGDRGLVLEPVPAPAGRPNGYAASLAADDLAGLPATVIITIGRDPLRDLGRAYAQLRQATGPTPFRFS